MKEQLIKEIQELTAQLRDDTGNMSQDLRENSVRDGIISAIKERAATLSELEKVEKTAHMPGTWNVGDGFRLTYLQLFIGGKEITKLPQPRVCKLVSRCDISKIDREALIFPVAVNSPIGRALHHKAGTEFSVELSDGHCIVRVSPYVAKEVNKIDEEVIEESTHNTDDINGSVGDTVRSI